jgi:IS1 family transposase
MDIEIDIISVCVFYLELAPEWETTFTRKDREPWNNTLRQRLGRFVRKTLSFSKSTFMHYICLSLFLHRYNLERASILK